MDINDDSFNKLVSDEDFNKNLYADILIEILEVFINNVLYVRNLYPSGIFKKIRFYRTTVFTSIFPDLNEYITNILKSARELLILNQLEKIAITFYTNNDVVLEVYIFDIKKNHLTECIKKDEYFIQVEEEVRNLLLCLDERLKSLKSLPINTNFKIFLHTTQYAFVKLTNTSELQQFPWLNGLENSNLKKLVIPLGSFSTAGTHTYAEIIDCS